MLFGRIINGETLLINWSFFIVVFSNQCKHCVVRYLSLFNEALSVYINRFQLRVEIWEIYAAFGDSKGQRKPPFYSIQSLLRWSTIEAELSSFPSFKIPPQVYPSLPLPFHLFFCPLRYFFPYFYFCSCLDFEGLGDLRFRCPNLVVY